MTHTPAPKFKVGDEVVIDGAPYIIRSMRWNNKRNVWNYSVSSNIAQIDEDHIG